MNKGQLIYGLSDGGARRPSIIYSPFGTCVNRLPEVLVFHEHVTKYFKPEYFHHDWQDPPNKVYETNIKNALFKRQSEMMRAQQLTCWCVPSPWDGMFGMYLGVWFPAPEEPCRFAKFLVKDQVCWVPVLS